MKCYLVVYSFIVFIILFLDYFSYFVFYSVVWLLSLVRFILLRATRSHIIQEMKIVKQRVKQCTVRHSNRDTGITLYRHFYSPISFTSFFFECDKKGRKEKVHVEKLTHHFVCSQFHLGHSIGGRYIIHYCLICYLYIGCLYC